MKKEFLKNWNIWAYVPALAAVCMIFFFGTQPGEPSGTASETVALEIYNAFDKGQHPLSYAQLEMLNGFIRSLAHMMEYALLSILIGAAFTANGIRRQLRSFYMFFCCVPVAFTDEFIQLFVKDRNGSFLDVLKDLFGAGLMAVFFFLFGAYKTLPAVVAENGSRRRAFMNIRIDDVAFSEAVEQIMAFAAEGPASLVITPNADHIVKAEEDPDYRRLYEKADLIVTDGMPLLWIAESMGCPILERVTGADLLPEICAGAEREGRRIFILATDEKLIGAAIGQLKQRFPGIPAADGYAPIMSFEEDETESEKILRKVADFHTDILVVALGAPKSEKWIAKYQNRLQCHVALPFGAAVSFIAKEKKRAPKWMQKRGLEWFSRFLQEPARLFKRYFQDDVKIFLLALKYRDRTVSGFTGEDMVE
ncbi:MAG: VanZ family protein [Lachnospiraceae bacterium]|nr:VanZ family protein [Lachnospiraceae bacterium]